MDFPRDNGELTRSLSRSNSDELINQTNKIVPQRRYSDPSVDSIDQANNSLSNMTLTTHCPLCRCPTRADETACRRCRLTTNAQTLTSDVFNQLSVPSTNQLTAQPNVEPQHNAEINEALTAFRFKLFAEMTPLISDLAKIVVDYLLWYRDVDDFHVNDRVDVADTRGSLSFNRSIHQSINQNREHWRWHRAVIRQIDRTNNKVLIAYDNYSRKWDQWIDIQSERLAPYGSMTQHLEDQTLKQIVKQEESTPIRVNKQSLDYDLRLCKEPTDAVNQSISQSIK